MIRKGDKPLQQIALRYSEREKLEEKLPFKENYILLQKHNNGPLSRDCGIVIEQYKVVKHKNFTINCEKIKDSFVLLNDQTFALVKNIIRTNERISLIINKIDIINSLYDEPDSKEIDICIGNASRDLSTISLNSVSCKAWRIPSTSGSILLPLHHSH